MKVRQLIDEDFVNYKKPSMFVGTCYCDWKCCKDADIDDSVCQNYELKNSKIIEIDEDELIQRYLKNNYTDAIVFGGLEPFRQWDEIFTFIEALRNDYNCDDDVVIYTGYDEHELEDAIYLLSYFSNIYVKFGRFVPDDEKHYDEVLGVWLASQNQYGKKISRD